MVQLAFGLQKIDWTLAAQEFFKVECIITFDPEEVTIIYNI